MSTDIRDHATICNSVRSALERCQETSNRRLRYKAARFLEYRDDSIDAKEWEMYDRLFQDRDYTVLDDVADRAKTDLILVLFDAGILSGERGKRQHAVSDSRRSSRVGCPGRLRRI